MLTEKHILTDLGGFKILSKFNFTQILKSTLHSCQVSAKY